MKVLFDGGIGLFVIPLQGQKIVATLIADLRSDGRLTAHSINRHNTAFVSDHRGTTEAHLATVRREADSTNVAVHASVLLTHQITGSPRRPGRGAPGG